MSNLKPNIFTFKRENFEILIYCETSENSKYALADQQGVILIKGEFINNHKISIDQLKPGYYTLTLLNSQAVLSFSVNL